MNKWISRCGLAAVIGVALTSACGPAEGVDPDGGGAPTGCTADEQCRPQERCDPERGLCALRPLSLEGESLTAFAGRPFNFPLTATGGLSPYTWSVQSVQAQLGWLTVDVQGALSGIPDAVAPKATVDVVVKDLNGATATATFDIEVVPCTGDCVGECTPGAVCRAAQSACDVAEVCNDHGACPADAVSEAGITCRPVSGDCDLPESCDGASPTCPADIFVAEGTVCRASTGVCDVEELCTGAAPECPLDAVQPAQTPCRDATGSCDAEETCDGVNTHCPEDAYQPAGTSCGAATCSNGIYTPAPTCEGDAPVCESTFPFPCGGYQCGTDTCRTTCSNQSHCMSTHYCAQNNQCLPKKPAGQPCSGPLAGHECQAGTCTGSYPDADGDGYGQMNSVQTFTCGSAIPAGRSANKTDCCDSDYRAFPGQTTAFATARNGCGGYDFNCDGNTTPAMVGITSCQTQNACASSSWCPGASGSFMGWHSYQPACGQAAPYVVSCGAVSSSCSAGKMCQSSTISQTQLCR